MHALFHYACSRGLSERLESIAPSWLEIRSCPESDDDRLMGLLADTDVLLHVLKPCLLYTSDAADE